jgi:hypothetical protein
MQCFEDEYSDFQSAIEWPDLRPPTEEATGNFRPIFSFVPDLVDNWAAAATIAPNCESPIEIELGARLIIAMRIIDDPSLKLIPQYVLGAYRYDFAITRKERLVALIECDGKDFHSTEE